MMQTPKTKLLLAGGPSPRAGHGLVTLALSLSLGACSGSVSDMTDDDRGGDGPGGGGGSMMSPRPGQPPNPAPNMPGPTMPNNMGPAPVPPPPAGCKKPSEPGATPLLKLSTVQYQNTVRDLLAASGLSALTPSLKDLLGSVPDDTNPTFSGLDNRISPNHVASYFNVATAIGDAVAAQPERLMALAGACAAEKTMSAKCMDDFLASFGRRALRRPLTTEEQTSYRQLNEAGKAPGEVIRNTIVVLLTSPRFVNHLEIEGTPVGGREDLLALSPYEIASRLSYTFWNTMPDEDLFKAAADGSIATEAGFGKQLQRVFNDARTRDTLWVFWSEWLKLESGFFGFDTTRAAFRNLVAGEGINERGKNHFGDMLQEIRDLTEWVAFTKKGTVRDLVTTNASVTKSADLARIYKTTPWNGMGEPPTIADGSREGLFTRAALMAVGEEQTSPFHRGAIVRKRFLCDPLAAPDPASLPENALEPPPASTTETTRQRFAKKTDGQPLCSGCHDLFNDIGYVLEAYDPIGRFRTMEKVFDKDGKIVGELPIDTTAVARIDFADMTPVKGPAEMVKRIADSKKVDRCFSENFFQFALRREVDDASVDACVVDDLSAELTKGLGMADAYMRLALQAGFRTRKVGAR
jgi:hypothetical protein